MAKQKLVLEEKARSSEVSLLDYTKRALYDYGAHVVEQRAVPDFRDGLKPVHRVILWSFYQLHVHHTSKFVKAALLVGDVIGKFHPHGDKSVYDAMVGLTGTKSDKTGKWDMRNCNVPYVEGFGNWGDNIDNAAGMRYPECRLSKFADLFMLDPDYLAVTPMVPNYSETLMQPLVLPAKLPMLLINGSTSIAVGVSAETPSFDPKGVVALVRMCLNGEKITPKIAVKEMTFQPTYGGKCTSSKAERLEFFKTGKATLRFMPEYEFDEKKKEFVITSYAPGLTSKSSIETFTNALMKMPNVKTVSNQSDKDGVRLVAHMRNRGLEFEETVKDIEKELYKKCRASFNMGIVERRPENIQEDEIPIEEKNLSFKNPTPISFIEEWCEWRIDLEKRVLKHLIAVQEQKLKYQELMLLAISNIQVIFESLKKDDSEAFLVKKLKITYDEAKTILDTTVRKLKALEKKSVSEKIKAHKAEIETLKKFLKKPQVRILKELETVEF